MNHSPSPMRHRSPTIRLNRLAIERTSLHAIDDPREGQRVIGVGEMGRADTDVIGCDPHPRGQVLGWGHSDIVTG